MNSAYWGGPDSFCSQRAFPGVTRSCHRAHDQMHVDANFSSIATCLSTSLQSDVGRPNHLAPLSSGSFTMDDSASSLGPVTIEPDSLASHNDVQSHHCRIAARYLEP